MKCWMGLPLVLVLVAAMFTMGCPSEVEEGNKLENPDFVLSGGQYRYVFNDPLIEDGKEYQVIFTIDECDDAFIGSRLGGKIAYKMDLNDVGEKVLSGWDYAIPTFVTETAKEYTWTFKAGAANADDVAIESPATTPTGGIQFFSLTAQNNWDNYPSSASFGVKGSFRVETIESVETWVSEGEVALGNVEGIAGKGAFSDEDMAKILALPERSKIVFTINVTVSTTGNSGAVPTWGICGVGGWDDSNSLQITVPADATPGANITFTAELVIGNILAIKPADQAIVVNPYNGATVTKAELFRPGE